MKTASAILAAIIFSILTVSAHAAMTIYPSSGTMHIVGIFVRDEPPDGAGGRGFYIQVDMQIPINSFCSGYPANTNTIHLKIPKKLNGGMTDNEIYRDLYNNAALAFALQKPVYVWVDGCAAGAPEVWAIDMVQ
jgi:hypothetical protein